MYVTLCGLCYVGMVWYDTVCYGMVCMCVHMYVCTLACLLEFAHVFPSVQAHLYMHLDKFLHWICIFA